MRIFKSVCLIVFKILLSIGIMCLVLSFCLEGFIKQGLYSFFISNPVSVEIMDDIGIDDEKIQKIIQSKEGKKFIVKYMAPLVDDSVTFENSNIGEDILSFINDNQKEIEKIIEQPLPMEKVEAYANSEEIQKINERYGEVARKVNKNVSVEIKDSMNVFKYFLSNEFRLIVTAICLISLVIIAIVQGAFYVWIRTLGNILMWDGVLVLCGSLIISVVLNMVDLSVDLNFANIFYSSLVMIGSGIICLVVYIVIKKIVSDRRASNEISEISG